MSPPKATIEDQIKKWERSRVKGCKSYVVKSWVVPFGIILPAVMILTTSLFSSNKGISIKHWGIFIAVFEPLFIGFIIFAGFSSWKYWEKRYERWMNEQQNGPLNLSGAKQAFAKYKQLILGIYSIPVFALNLLLFLAVIFFGRHIDTSNSFVVPYVIAFFFVFIFSFLPILNVMVFVKNPICGHGILSNPDYLHRHPDAKGNYWINAWKIMLKQPFICLDCADIYIFEKKEQQFEIIKKDRKI